MPKVTYILGAGASAGQKDVDGNRLRGVPTICEFAQECQSCIAWLKTQNYDGENSQLFEHELEWLYSICSNYPTVDTYAKLLFAIQQSAEYERLKTVLSFFLTLVQKRYPRDIRYDGWVAALVDENGSFPDNMNILSWNYDAQFEMAYSGYLQDVELKKLWGITNVLNKTFVYTPKNNDKFSIVKLNGTAFLHWGDGMGSTGIYDLLVYPQNDRPIENMLAQMFPAVSSTNVVNELSYAWEKRDYNDVFIQAIKNKVQDTEVVVVIGYSFPYVNRFMDKFIFASMPKLQKIYVQDLNAESVVETMRGRIDGREHILIVPQKGLNQFYIPNELD